MTRYISFIYRHITIVLWHDDVIKWKHFPRYWPFVRVFTGHRWIPCTSRPVTRRFDVFFDLRLNKLLSKQSGGWWFETPSRPLWRHCNGIFPQHAISWYIPPHCHIDMYITNVRTTISRRRNFSTQATESTIFAVAFSHDINFIISSSS